MTDISAACSSNGKGHVQRIMLDMLLLILMLCKLRVFCEVYL